MADCDNLRKIVINMINTDNSIDTVTKYFDVDSMVEVTTTEAKLCPNIESISIDCAVVCDV